MVGVGGDIDAVCFPRHLLEHRFMDMDSSHRYSILKTKWPSTKEMSSDPSDQDRIREGSRHRRYPSASDRRLARSPSRMLQIAPSHPARLGFRMPTHVRGRFLSVLQVSQSHRPPRSTSAPLRRSTCRWRWTAISPWTPGLPRLRRSRRP